jgi:hypothetical protein
MEEIYAKLRSNKGPSIAESKKILATAAIDAIRDNEDIKFVRIYYEDWPDKKQKNFTKMQTQIIERLERWGKIH